jgi:hypothetical protein
MELPENFTWARLFIDLAKTFNCHRRVTHMRYPNNASVAG